MDKILTRRNFITSSIAGGLAYCGTRALAATPAAASGAVLQESFGKTFDVALFGAREGEEGNVASAIQAAIDAAHQSGGGVVHVRSGLYRIGPVYLKDNVLLNLDPGAVLKATDLFDDYGDDGVVNAIDATNVGICGLGMIDGNGLFLGKRKGRKGQALGATVAFTRCSQVLVRDFRLKEAFRWGLCCRRSDNVNIDGVSIDSRVNPMNDGIDIDSCSRVRISNCNVNSYDDCIVLKSTTAQPCRDVTVTNCVLSTNCTALKTGTESRGGFENICFDNCTIYGTRSAAMALNLVDGGVSNNISITNITVSMARTVLSIRLGSRNRNYNETEPAPQKPGVLQNIYVGNIQATGIFGFPISVCGLKEQRIENLTFDNIRVQMQGGGGPGHKQTALALADAFDAAGDAANAKRYREMTFPQGDSFVPEPDTAYPDDKMFGPLPAYGFYLRHVKGVVLRNVELSTLVADARPALVFDQVADIELSALRIRSESKAKSSIAFSSVTNAFITGCCASAKTAAFVNLENASDVTIQNNDFSKAGKVASGELNNTVFIDFNRV